MLGRFDAPQSVQSFSAKVRGFGSCFKCRFKFFAFEFFCVGSSSSSESISYARNSSSSSSESSSSSCSSTSSISMVGPFSLFCFPLRQFPPRKRKMVTLSTRRIHQVSLSRLIPTRLRSRFDIHRRRRRRRLHLDREGRYRHLPVVQIQHRWIFCVHGQRKLFGDSRRVRAILCRGRFTIETICHRQCKTSSSCHR